MTWQPYQPRGTAPLRRGKASLSKRGTLTILDQDLEDAGITGNQVAIDTDATEHRIRLREPSEKERNAGTTLRLCAANQRRTRSSKININGVLDAMQIHRGEAGRCTAIVQEPEGLIIILPAPAERPRTRATPIAK